MKIDFTRLTSTAIAPAYAHPTDAGMDLFADEEMIIAPNTRAVVRTGIALAIPEGNVGLVWDKSGLAVHNGLTTIAGVIDASYRGEIQVAVYNTGNEPYVVVAGHKIAQLLIQPIARVHLQEVTELPNTARGDGGFGSTGLTAHT